MILNDVEMANNIARMFVLYYVIVHVLESATNIFRFLNAFSCTFYRLETGLPACFRSL